MPTGTRDLTNSAHVRRATMADLPRLTLLFEAYRAFYRVPPSEVRARNFLAQRIARGESVVFVAEVAATPRDCVGFVQLYPSFSSLALGRTEILNDLYVEPAHRRGGIAMALVSAAIAHARSRGATRLELATEHGNAGALALYRALGFEPDSGFARLALELA